VLVDRYDAGLRHVSGTNPIERDLGDLQPGQTRVVEIKLLATQAGRACNTIEVQQQGGGVLGSGQACIMAVAAAPPTGAGAAAAPAGERPKLLVKKTGPARKNVGE